MKLIPKSNQTIGFPVFIQAKLFSCCTNNKTYASDEHDPGNTV